MLHYTIRVALRSQLRRPESWNRVAAGQDWSAEQRKLLADIAVAVASPEAAEFLFQELQRGGTPAGKVEGQLSHLAVNLPADRIADIVVLVRDKLQLDDDQQAKLLPVLNQRLAQRGIQGSTIVRDWAHELAQRLLSSDRNRNAMWMSGAGENPWGLEPRRCADGQTATFLSSLPGGEQRTSILKSHEFVIPPQLTFYLCGHLGFPDRPAIERNYLQLRLAGSDQVISKAIPPRNDTAQRVEWDLSQHAGQRGYLEIVDQLDLTAYAWLAVARFEPAVVSVPQAPPSAIVDRQIAAAGLAAALKLAGLREPLLALVSDQQADWRVRQAAFQACLVDADRPLLNAMSTVLASANIATALRHEVAAALDKDEGTPDQELLARVMQSAPANSDKSPMRWPGPRPEAMPCWN
jgi:hypothetical protein